ncbi:alpha/beta hydrolase [Chelatococcus reniformis]|nr:dienelactone hydrolase family protein [Chelatococcus reniformis]
MAQTIDGPRLAPRSGRAKRLVVLLHGYGADGNDLIEIGRQWQAWLPDTYFVAPHAPSRLPQMPTGRQWFPLTMRDPNERWVGANAAQPVIDAFLDAEFARHGLDESKLALVGFSQGTMMALHVGLRRARPPAALLGYSGLLVADERAGTEALKDDIRGRPPVLLIHGEADDLIPADALFLSAEGLAKAEVPCQWHLCPGLGHGIDAEGLRHGGLFLTQCFGLPYPARGAAG